MDDFTLDIREWTARFPIESLRAEAAHNVDGSQITSPRHLVVIEQIRREAAISGSLGKAVPTDVFVFGHGEPSRRDVTKVGGLPYRPAGKPWPTVKRDPGTPLTFVAQFRFTESSDIVGRVPGDLLLLFCEDSELPARAQDELVCEWYPLGLDRLVSADEIPPPSWTFVTAFGLRHRTADYPEAWDAFAGYEHPWLLTELQGTKIGGVPSFIQYDPELPGRFLCSLGSVWPEVGGEYPWTNSPEPLARGWPAADEMTLMWNDVGSLYLYLDDKSRIHWTAQSH